MNYKLILSFLISSLFLLACEKEDPVFEFRIDENLQIFVDDFYEEAELRGVVLTKDNLIVEFVDALEDDKCGQCERPKGKKQQQRVVKINRNSGCWDQKPIQNKEALVFHELGHCLLNRDHKDDLFPSGAPKSIMTTVLDGPYQPCIYVFGEDGSVCNKTVRRTYYIDELFNENLDETPSWAN